VPDRAVVRELQVGPLVAATLRAFVTRIIFSAAGTATTGGTGGWHSEEVEAERTASHGKHAQCNVGTSPATSNQSC
jgi:hypothetical protein